MKIMKHTIFFFGLFLTLVAWSQTGGEHVFSYLNLTTSPRQAALGGSVYSLNDDVSQPFWNPACINNTMDGQTAFNYLNYLGDIQYLSLSGVYELNPKIGSFHAGINYLTYGTLIEADELGNETGEFHAYDMSLSVGYAYTIPNTALRIGANMKFLQSLIAEFNSTGIATDVGLYYESKEPRFTLAAVVRNAGVQLMTYDGLRESLPLQVSIGGSLYPEHMPFRWFWAMDDLLPWKIAYPNPSDEQVDFNGNVSTKVPGFFDNLFRHFSTGVEMFSGKGFNLRVGYNARRARELRINNVRTFAGLSFGFGLRVKRFHLDYAYSRYHPVSDSHTFGITVKLFDE